MTMNVVRCQADGQGRHPVPKGACFASISKGYHPHSAARAGITLLEVMIVIGIITLLVAITLPAIQAARESARLLQCRDNLHQIGIATHNFHTSHGKLPWTGSPFLKLLPDMGERAVAEAISNNKAIPASPAVFLCPSDHLADASQVANSYHINGGSAIDPFNGVFELKSTPTRSFRDLTDGLSVTALFSERLVRITMFLPIPLDVAHRNPLRFFWQTDIAFLPGQEEELAAWCLNPTNQANADLGFGQIGGDTLYIEGAYYNHLLPPNNWSFSNDGNNFRGPYPATSLHSGGVNLLMADGAVRFVSSSIDLAVWRAVGSRAGGETVGDF